VQPVDRDRKGQRSYSVRKTCIIFITPDQPHLARIQGTYSILYTVDAAISVSNTKRLNYNILFRGL
jgi:hypothetical protein